MTLLHVISVSVSDYVCTLLLKTIRCQVWLSYMPTLPDTTTISSRTGHQISRIKLRYELFCALIWNLSHFVTKFEFPLIQSSASGAFSHVFHHWQRLFPHYTELWWFCTSCTTSYNVLSRLGTGSSCAYLGGGGVLQKKESPVFRAPEVGISELCTTTIVQTLSLL